MSAIKVIATHKQSSQRLEGWTSSQALSDSEAGYAVALWESEPMDTDHFVTLIGGKQWRLSEVRSLPTKRLAMIQWGNTVYLLRDAEKSIWVHADTGHLTPALENAVKNSSESWRVIFEGEDTP